MEPLVCSKNPSTSIANESGNEMKNRKIEDVEKYIVQAKLTPIIFWLSAWILNQNGEL